MYFSEAGTGPAGDLQAATTAACQMVGALGMGTTLVSFDAAAINGAGNVVAKVLANDNARTAVEQILDDAKAVAAGLLHDHAHVLEALRDALLEREELVGEEILDVIHRADHVGDDEVLTLGAPARGDVALVSPSTPIEDA
jgi:ATP-dependent Zn protease